MNTQSILITDWLKKPKELSAHDMDLISQQAALYTFYVPFQWIKNAAQYSKNGYSQELNHASVLVQTNWYQYIRCLNYEAWSFDKGLIAHEASEQQITQDILEPTQETLIIEPTEQASIIEENQLLEYEKEAAQGTLAISEDYFQSQGISLETSESADEINTSSPNKLNDTETPTNEDKSLMLMMSFGDWLNFLKKQGEEQRAEEEDKAALKTKWQRDKLAAALEDETDNIPESVFEMAINSINKEDILVSEPLAEIHIKQGNFDKAIEIYRKLSLLNPEKKTYFATKIENLNKDKII